MNLGGNLTFSLEDALLRNHIRTIGEIRDIAPKDIRLMLSSYLLKFEVECMKSLLRVKKANLSVDEGMKYIFPTGRLTENRCKKILKNTENVGDVISSISDLEYGLVLEKALELYKKTKIFHLLGVFLEKYVYFKIWESIEKFRGLDNKIAKRIIGLEIDFINIKNVIRFKELGIDIEQISKYIIPFSELLNQTNINEILTFSNRKSLINSLIKIAKKSRAIDHLYAFKELDNSIAKSLSEIEKNLDREFIKTNLRIIKRYTQFFNIGILLAFLNLKWFEIKNLIIIIRGSELGIDSEKINKLLIL
jgi:vacuolar-type H+-ATPase subunit C/Vma6